MLRTRGALQWSALLMSLAIAACGGGGGRTNRPPSISAVSIGPASPRVTDALTAHATISDPDGDAQILKAIDPRTGALVWRSPALNRTASRNSLHYVDTNEDGEPQIAFGSSLGLYVTR